MSCLRLGTTHRASMMLHSVCLIAAEEVENIDFRSQVLSINFSGIPRFNAAHQSANRIK